MTELCLTRTPAGALAPADATTAEYLGKLRVGQALHGKFTKQRNPKFHRKVLSLFIFAFERWDAPELQYRGQPVAKEFDRFRKDLTILAGHYTAVTNIKGEVRLEAKSISYANMDDDEFEGVFKSLLTTVWNRVLSSQGYETPEAVEALINELMSYDS